MTAVFRKELRTLPRMLVGPLIVNVKFKTILHIQADQ